MDGTIYNPTMTDRVWVITTLLLLSALGACGSATQDAETTRLWIKADLVDCEGVAPQTCMEVAESVEGPYELFYDTIEGYGHVEGSPAIVDVVIEDVDDPPADGSSLKYTLVEIVE